jgi:hypothetical protein
MFIFFDIAKRIFFLYSIHKIVEYNQYQEISIQKKTIISLQYFFDNFAINWFILNI